MVNGVMGLLIRREKEVTSFWGKRELGKFSDWVKI